MKFQLYFLLVLVFIASCNHKQPVDNDSPKTEPAMPQLNWNELRDRFPHQDVRRFDFESDATDSLVNEVEEKKVDSLTFGLLAAQIPTYSNWQDEIDLYYFSRNMIDNIEVGVFLKHLNFDGLEVSFDMIHVDKNGTATLIAEIAKGWSVAECIGYQNACLNYDKLEVECVEFSSCYDDSQDDEEAIDSIYTIRSLKNLDLQLLYSDTVRW
jgi:hypothetical protein